MRVIIINTHPEDYLGGSQIQCDLFASFLKKKRHEVLYLALRGIKTSYDADYQVTPVQLNSTDVYTACKSFSPDIVYWRFNKKVFLSCMKELNKLNCPLIFGVSHINDLKRWGYKSSATNSSIKGKINDFRKLANSAWNHFGFRYIDGLTVNNSDFLNMVKISHHIYIPNSMPVKHKTFEWPKPYCVWVANIKPTKRPEQYLQLARSLEPTNIDFLMVGEIQNKNYKFIANGVELPSNLYYLGPKPLEEVNGILKKSMFLVHTCEPEGFPNIIIQAWLQGKPVVSLNFDPNGYLESENIGYYSRNMNQFIEDVSNLIKNNAEREALGKKAQNFAHKKFSIERNGKFLEEFFLKTIEQTKNR